MIAEELATWATGPLSVPPEVQNAALRHLLDGLGCAIAAKRSGAADPAVTVARGLAGPEEATILGTSSRVSAPAAALASGALVHALDFDDTHAGGLVHATSVVLPAAFAVGEQVAADGRAVVDAAVVGYEVVCRVAAAAPHGFHSRGLHATMVAGVFSAAAVTARLMGLDARTATNALGIAGSSAGGLLAFLATDASTKQLHPGLASQAGILATRLAAAGATGPRTVLDGPHGIYEALASGDVDRSSVVAGLGDRWETTRIGIKPWPTCQLAHAAMAAAASAVERAGVPASEIVEVHASVHPDSASVVCDDSRDLTRPSSPYGAKFSLPWSVAALLLDGRVGIDTYSDSQLRRPDISELAARVNWTLTERRGVAADAPSDVVLVLRDGHRVEGHVDRSPGGGTAPLDDAALLGKLDGNVGGEAGSLAEAMRSLPHAPDLTVLTTLAARAADLLLEPRA